MYQKFVGLLHRVFLFDGKDDSGVTPDLRVEHTLMRQTKQLVRLCKRGLEAEGDAEDNIADGKFSDRGRTRQKFCCPLKSSKNGECPCHHKNFYNGKKHRGCTKYLTVPDDLRLSVDRNSKYFKSTYSLRTECERYNSRFKNTGQERMWVRNRASVTNLNTFAHISLLAVAAAAVTTRSNQSYRKLKTRKRTA